MPLADELGGGRFQARSRVGMVVRLHLAQSPRESRPVVGCPVMHDVEVERRHRCPFDHGRHSPEQYEPNSVIVERFEDAREATCGCGHGADSRRD